ncbi:two-component system chemotaxis response regulator CheB [Bacillus ectoiniformans]|uniref:protein-glutamate methylesterase/protein-glutamine glutaminase n=1 Tax=Bacillus ectoiniformans TaxID=1494429 RepID=UPI0019587F7E|nr:chemotaxis response regulator protein-glutamate methylesterase [Bacillus ectoiniformans]MBM7647111.1 two-component system chemotaxis response regulator CheB [Bacillus ectoiniformans]
MNRKKVLIADDSAFMRKLIADFLSTHPDLFVVGTARNGKDAIKKLEQLNPDVMTMDVEMPEMNGLEALRYIMQHQPTPVVMLSSLTKEGADAAMTAMDYGAVDFIAKPSGTISLDLHKVKDELIEKVLSASKVNVTRLGSSPSSLEKVPPIKESIEEQSVLTRTTMVKHWSQSNKKIIAIGTSTGGPRALQQVLTKIPAAINAPILVVQHMPPGFTKSLAQRLDSLSDIHVKEAEDGEILQKGTAYIAPGDYHLKVKKIGASIAVHLDQSSPVNGHRPAVDVMFHSLSEMNDVDKVAVIMTGMGSDGANGLIQLKETGNVRAIAESKESCIVFGMPKAAIATHLIDEVSPLEQIAEVIVKYLP